MCDFVCGTISRAMVSLNWSVIHYKAILTDILGVVRKYHFSIIIVILSFPILTLRYKLHPGLSGFI